MRRLLRDLAIVIFFGFVAVAATWPLAARLRTAVPDLGDPLLNSWILDWDCYALTHAPLAIYDAPIFHPSMQPLAYTENLIAVAIALLPFYLAGSTGIALHGMALLIGYALSCYGGFVLARTVTRRTMPSIIAGIVYGFVPYKLAHLQHVQIIWAVAPPLALAAVIAYRRQPSQLRAIAIGACVVFAALTNVYYFLFTSAAIAMSFALIAIAEKRERRFWSQLAIAGLLTAIALLPFLAPYASVARQYRMHRGKGESLGASATAAEWLVAPARLRFRAQLVDAEVRQNERELFPGFVLPLGALVALLLLRRRERPAPPDVTLRKPPRWVDVVIVLLAAISYVLAVAPAIQIGRVRLETATLPAMLLTIALIARFTMTGSLRAFLGRSRVPLELWIAALWIVIGVAGSFGMRTFFHSFLFQYVFGFRATRAPARWAMIAYCGLAPWAAVGISELRLRRSLQALLLVVALVDVWPRVQWEHAVVDRVEVDQWLNEAKAGPVFFVPGDDVSTIVQYMTRASAHHQPMMNGISGFEPPLHRRLREEPLGESTLELLERNGCRYVVVRPDWCGWKAPLVFDWLRHSIATGRLAFVRRFEWGINGDWVFAVARNERGWQRHRAPAVRDRAGFTPDEELQRLLAGQATFSNTTFGYFSAPAHHATIDGALQVNGWALSPFGIREVNVLVDSARRRYRAALFPQSDLTQRFPWYPETPAPAFAIEIPRRPDDVDVATDVQVEIIDGRGVATYLPDHLIQWR